MLFDKKGDNNSHLLMEIVEKMENKIMAVDQQMLMLKNEQGKGFEGLSKLEF